jgi:hypothetical protein
VKTRLDPRLAAEGRLIGRYLVGVDPAPELIERYCRANEVLFTDAPSPADRSILHFLEKHPRSLSLLEAAAGLVQPASRLRRKIIVMMAILETAPEHAGHFEFAGGGTIASVARLAGLGAVASVKVVAGLIVYGIARHASVK